MISPARASRHTRSREGTLTQVAAYRQTICSVKAADYLLRRINAVPEPIVLAATQARLATVAAARVMIEQLHWSDFEILIDLIFARGGWQRTTRLGETMADVDLLIEQTTLSETASVQIKSRASQGVLDALIEMHRKSGRHRGTFFVCHTAETAMSAGEHGDVHLWTGEFLAEIAVRSRFGLASLIGLWNARGSRPNSRQGFSNGCVCKVCCRRPSLKRRCE